SENKQKLKINGAVVEARDGAVANLVVKKQQVPFLGVYAVPLNPAVAKQLNLADGLYLSLEQAIPDSPAAKAGLERFDVLMKFDDQILVNPQQLQALVRSKKQGDWVTLSILRGGDEKTIKVQLGEQQVPKVAFGRAWPVPDPVGPRIFFGGQGFQFGPDAGMNFKHWMDDLDGNLDLRFGLGDDARAQILRQLQRHRGQLGNRGDGLGPELNDSELLKKYDADGDGKLSRLERDKARDEGTVPGLNFDLDLDFGLGIPKVDDLLRDARRRGAASTWSSVSGSVQTKVVTMDDTGSYEFSSNDGKKRFKATSPDGEVLFDGPVNTKEERSKVPESLRQRLDSIESNVKVRIHSKPGRDLQPPKRNKKGKGKKDQLL
ncbi:MAG: PDZ domain-containing protein, partial [Opitutales bacterium]